MESPKCFFLHFSEESPDIQQQKAHSTPLLLLLHIQQKRLQIFKRDRSLEEDLAVVILAQKKGWDDILPP